MVNYIILKMRHPLLSLILVLLPVTVFSQTFTKITTGNPVNDGGDSRAVTWIDYDNDGLLDLFVTNGPSAGQNNFRTYGHSWGDYDRDGDLDMFGARVNVSGGSNNNILFRNDDASGNSWIGIKCEGVTSNASGIGAAIRIQSSINGNTVLQTRIVQGQDGYCAQNLEQHFGLGNSTVIDSVIIDWPSGTTDRYGNININKLYKAVEGQSFSVGVHQLGTEIPYEYHLYQNYPNPFNPITTIKYDLAKPGFVVLRVFDISGREVAELVNGTYNAGTYSVNFDAGSLTSGVYLYTLRSNSFYESRKMLLVK